MTSQPNEETMATATAEQAKDISQPNGNARSHLPAIRPPRLPFHPAIEERFGIGKSEWWALVEAVFPLATSIDSVILALSYCKARKLDPFKKNVHIVPIYNGQLKRMVDTIWPGIGELRTTAFRTGQYAGRGETVYGPDLTRKVGGLEITFPEWAQITVNRLVQGQVVSFTGPRVYWLETYAHAGRNDATPNSMWARRTRGQLEKCSEAAALRAAFPEEIGNEYTNDEVGQMQFGDAINTTVVSKTPETDARDASDRLADILEGKGQSRKVDPDTDEENGRKVATETPDEMDYSEGDLQGEDAGGDEPDTQESIPEESPGRPDLSLMIGEEERPIDYVARLKEVVGKTQSTEVVKKVNAAALACWDRLDNPDAQFNAVERACSKRIDQLESAAESGQLMA